MKQSFIRSTKSSLQLKRIKKWYSAILTTESDMSGSTVGTDITTLSVRLQPFFRMTNIICSATTIGFTKCYTTALTEWIAFPFRKRMQKTHPRIFCSVFPNIGNPCSGCFPETPVLSPFQPTVRFRMSFSIGSGLKSH